MNRSESSGGSALDVLKLAMKAVPSLRYALGVAGLVAGIAIVKGFGIDSRIAVFGTVVMLVLMTVLVVFARVAADKPQKSAALVFTWFALVLVMATAAALFISVFFKWPLDLQYLIVKSARSLSFAEQEASRLEDEVMILRGAWENMDNSRTDRERVAEHGPKLGESLLLLRNEDLRLAWQVVKYEYALYAFTMAASAFPGSTDSDKQAKLRTAKKGLAAGNHGLKLISKIRNCYPNTDECREALGFILREEDEERLKYLSAICLCREAELEDASLKSEAQKLIDGIAKSHLNKYPTERNQEFRNCVK